jgi:hypothetical protein
MNDSIKGLNRGEKCLSGMVMCGCGFLLSVKSPNSRSKLEFRSNVSVIRTLINKYHTS